MYRRAFSSFLLGFAALAASLSAEPLLYRIEVNHSTIGFAVPIFAGLSRVSGKFTDADVEIILDEEDLQASSVRVVLQVSGIDTGISLRDQDLQGPLFFDAATHPEIRFISKRIEKQSDTQYLAVGDLQMKGITREVQLPFKFRIHRFDDGSQVLGVSLRTELNRLDYGVGNGWKHTSMENFLGNQVAVEIDLWTRSGRPVH